MASLGLLGALGGLGQTATQLGTLSMQSQIEDQRQASADARAMRLEKYRSEQNRADDQFKIDQADKRATKDDAETSKIYSDYMASKYPASPPSATPTALTPKPATGALTTSIPDQQAPSPEPTVNTKYGKLTYDDAIGLATEFTRNRKKDAAKEMIDLAKELKPAADKFMSIGENGIYDTLNNKVVVAAQPKKLNVDEQAIQAYMAAHPGKNAFDAKVALAVAGRTPAQAREVPLDKQAAYAWLRKNPGKDVNDYIDREKPNSGDKGERDTTQANTLLSQLKAIHGADEFGNIPKDEANLLAEELPIAKKLRDAGASIEDSASQAYKDVKDGKRAAHQPITTSKPNGSAKKSDVRSKADKILGL